MDYGSPAYSSTVNCTTGPSSTEEDIPIDVTASPFLRVYGGGVVAGGKFLGSDGICTPVDASISNDVNKLYQINAKSAVNSSGEYIGSGSQLTVAALLSINGFYSDSIRGSSNPKRLTIANTEFEAGFNNLGTSTFGGGSGISTCATNYFDSTRDSDSMVSSLVDGLPAGKAQYLHSGNLIISDVIMPGVSGDKQIPLGTQLAVYVEGDVLIDRNIVYAESAASVDEMPNLYIIAKGNIYIHSNVTNIDGNLIAQPTSSNTEGKVYTCSTAINAVPSTSAKITECANKLTINGSLYARDIKFGRTYGKIDSDQTSATEGMYEASQFSAAEVINYTPEVYVAPSPLKKPGSPSLNGNTIQSGRYDYIATPPPVF